MDPHETSDSPHVCLDSDVVIAGLFSRDGASHALLVLAEMGLLGVAMPQAAVDEIQRNLAAKLPEALPLFERFLDAPWVGIYVPTAEDLRAAGPRAHPKDAPLLAAAMASGASILATHNTRHFQGSKALRVLKPATVLREIRAWMVRFGA